ncbi:ADAMTS-like protein 1 [Hippopotamus amphibius kiboko]|uniref:ADAMTS-like protein 1 n=1 Tax=Hippopotamus amphibius kiboko TaxID=575201 RepID=UPI002596C820|nr:ADAMTS-like protein 1 [Hippopotamus amphibius kiboko]
MLTTCHISGTAIKGGTLWGVTLLFETSRNAHSDEDKDNTWDAWGDWCDCPGLAGEEHPSLCRDVWLAADNMKCWRE